jgi:hypothetical protein
MAIDIFNIKPSVISRDLRGKYVLLYGKAKSGKTTAACAFPHALLCAFEKGYNAIGGVMAQDITKWSDFKLVLRQLEKPEAHDLYETIIIDTVSIAWDACEQFVCAQNSVQKITDIPWGGGYSACKKEFEGALRKITQMGYGVVLISHNAVRIEKNAAGEDVEIISPELPKRAAEICNGIVDIIGYIGNEYVDGQVQRWLYTRETPTLFAGSRFKYLPPKIKFGYDELVAAIAEAIEKSEKLDGATVVDKAETTVAEKLDYNAIRAEAEKLWTALVLKDPENPNEDNAKRIMKRIEMVFGKATKLSEITEDQVDLYNLVLLDMRDLAKEQGLV